MEHPIKNECTSLYTQIKMSTTIDLRDNRGKKHCLAFVLLGVMLALLRNKDGNLSSIHRAIKNTNEQLCNYLQLPLVSAVSRAQLPIILKK